MIALLIYVLLVLLVAVVLIYVVDLLIGMLPGGPPHLQTILRIVIVLIALLMIIDRALPLMGEPGLIR